MMSSNEAGSGSEGGSSQPNPQGKAVKVSPNVDGTMPVEQAQTQTVTMETGSVPPGTYLRRSTIDGVLVMTTLRLLEVAIQKERMVHVLAAVHYKALYDWFLFLPAILLTMIGGIIAFLANEPSISDAFLANEPSISDEDKGALYSTGVGIISLVSVFWQSLTKQLNLGSRAMQHESVAVALARIVEELPFYQLDPNMSVEETDIYLNQLNEKFSQAVDTNTSVPPLRITSAFHSVRSQLDLYLSLHNYDVCREFGMKREDVYMAGCSELFAIFSNYFMFPFWLPSSKYATDRTLKNLRDKFNAARHAPINTEPGVGSMSW